VAIGSNPEVGALFKPCKDFTMQDWEDWWEYMRNEWGSYLQTGHSTLVHHKKGNPYYDLEARRG
jgi:hypothetical protein